MKKTIEIAFKKNLGKGRAWITPKGFTSDFYDLIVSPFAELFKYFKGLKKVHFSTVELDENNLINNEELFDITPRATLEERAEDIDLAWKMLSGNSAFQTLENYLQRAGFEVYIYENTDDVVPNLGKGFNYGGVQYGGEVDDKKVQYGGHLGKVIGNRFLNIAGKIKDPAQFINGKHAFYIQGFFDPSDKDWDRIIEIVLRLKPAHAVAVCQIAERKEADNLYAETEDEDLYDVLDGGEAETEFFKEKINDEEEL
jgi:hypothetical protein